MADASYDPYLRRSLRQHFRIDHMRLRASVDEGESKLSGFVIDMVDALTAAGESENYWLDIVAGAWALPASYPDPSADWETYDTVMDALWNVPHTANLAKFYSAATQLKAAFERFEEKWQESGLLVCYYMGCAWRLAFPPEDLDSDIALRDVLILDHLRRGGGLASIHGMGLAITLGNELDYPLMMTCGGQGDFTGYSTGDGTTVAPQMGSISPQAFGGYSIREISTRVESQLYVTIEGRRPRNFFSAIKLPAIQQPIQTSGAAVVQTDTYTRWTWNARLATLPASGQVQVSLLR